MKRRGDHMKQQTYDKYRNIYFEYTNGSSIESLSEKYGMCMTSIYMAIRYMKQEENNKENILYMTIKTYKPESCTRIYNVLRRNYCDSLEQLRNINTNRVKTFRGCGKKTLDQIIELKEHLNTIAAQAVKSDTYEKYNNMCNDYENGMKASEIMQKYDVDRDTVYKICSYMRCKCAQNEVDTSIDEYRNLWESEPNSIATYNALRRYGIHTIDALMQLDMQEALKIRNIGAKRVEIIKKVIEKIETTKNTQ